MTAILCFTVITNRLQIMSTRGICSLYNWYWTFYEKSFTGFKINKSIFTQGIFYMVIYKTLFVIDNCNQYVSVVF